MWGQVVHKCMCSSLWIAEMLSRNSLFARSNHEWTHCSLLTHAGTARPTEQCISSHVQHGAESAPCGRDQPGVHVGAILLPLPEQLCHTFHGEKWVIHIHHRQYTDKGHLCLKNTLRVCNDNTFSERGQPLNNAPSQCVC